MWAGEESSDDEFHDAEVATLPSKSLWQHLRSFISPNVTENDFQNRNVETSNVARNKYEEAHGVSDEDDFEEDFKRSNKHTRNNLPYLKVYKNQRSRLGSMCYSIFNVNNTFVTKLYSTDKKQYIEKYFENDIIIYSGQFSEDDLDIAVYGKNNLLTLNQANFVARIEINIKENLDFSESFINVKKKFFQGIVIIKILEDELSEKFQKMYCSLKHFLISRSKQTAVNLQVAEDFLQLVKILERYKKQDDQYLSLLSMFHYILKDKYISIEFKNKIEDMLKVQSSLESRKKFFPIFENSIRYIRNLVIDLKMIVDEGAKNHREALLSNCFKMRSPFSNIIPTYLNSLSIQQRFYIRNADLNLISNLTNVMDEEIFTKFLEDLCNSFFLKIKKRNVHTFLTELAPLTHPVYFHLCKIFQELILEIGETASVNPTSLFKKEWGRWVFAKNINFPPSLLNQSLEQQYRLIFKLMAHFKPGYYLESRKFCYELKSTNKIFWLNSRNSNANTSKPVLNVPEDRLVWIYILDVSITNLLPKEQMELFHPIIQGHEKFITETKDDLYALFQEITSNTARFVIQTSPYFTNKNSKGKIDKNILENQMKYFCEIVTHNQLTTTNFRDLVDVYHEYWKSRESIIQNIPDKFPFGKFKSKMEEIFENLLKIVYIALSKKVNPDDLIKFFRGFNDFIFELDCIEFAWFVKKDNEDSEAFIFPYVKLINKEKRTYKVLDHEGFILKCDSEIPRNHLIELIDELLKKVIKLLEKIEWCDNDVLNASNELLNAIRKSLLYFKEQPNYVSFELFKNENTKPFDSIIQSSTCYEDFMKRINILGECFWYLRKQDEIDICKALELYSEKNNEEDTEILKKCYEKYLEKFNFYIEKTASKSYKNKIKSIVEDVLKYEKIKINEWEEEFKKDIVPEILAGLAAVWSIQESKDIASTGISLKPHCIQILCIFKLLSIDLNSKGVQNHLAEVLTGQGKSLVLGLLSTLLALMGHKVRLVCYNKYLADRDQNDFANFFREFYIFNEIKYGTFKEMADEIIAPQVNGRKHALRELVKNRILNHNSEQIESIMEENINNTILLIDEVDVFFTNEFYGNTLNAGTRIDMKAFAIIQEQIWAMAENEYNNHTIFMRINEFVDNMIKEGNQDFLELKKFLIKPGTYYLLTKDPDLIQREYTNKSLYEESIKEMIAAAINIANAIDQHKRYEIGNEGLIGSRNNFGIIAYNIIGYNVIFNYFRLKKNNYEHKFYRNYGYLDITCGKVCYAKLPENYCLILGVSGTLTNLYDHEKTTIHESYNINNISYMPSFFGRSNLIFDTNSNVIIKYSEDEWMNTIFNYTNIKLSLGVSIIIFFDTHSDIDKFKEKYQNNFTRLNVLTHDTDSKIKEKYIEEAGITKTVTLAARGIGRGTDFKSSLTVEKNGGTHVIQTFFSIDIKEEIQIKGRTARKDNKGSYELILCTEHLPSRLTGSDYKGLNVCRNQLMFESGSENKERIALAEDAHKTTMKFLKSFFK